MPVSPGMTCVRSTTAGGGLFFLLELGNDEEKGDFMGVQCLLALV